MLWVQIPALPFSGCVTLGESFSPLLPWLPHLEMGMMTIPTHKIVMRFKCITVNKLYWVLYLKMLSAQTSNQSVVCIINADMYVDRHTHMFIHTFLLKKYNVSFWHHIQVRFIHHYVERSTNGFERSHLFSNFKFMLHTWTSLPIGNTEFIIF